MLSRDPLTTCFFSQYENFASEILKNIAEAMERNFHLLEEVGLFITSKALTSASTFPNVTLPQFKLFANHTHEGVGGFLASIYAPLVTEQERVPWEQYTTQTPWWHNLTDVHSLEDERSRERKEKESSMTEQSLQDAHVPTFIYNRVNEENVEVPKNATGLYAPLWHMSPMDLNAINENLFAFPTIVELYSEMIATHDNAMSGAIEIDHFFDFAFDDDYRHTDNPHCVVMEAVYDSFSDNQAIVGMLVALLSYDRLLTAQLPNTTEGLVIVFKESCGRTFTYSMSALNVIFMGYEDLHDPSYDSYKRSVILKIHDPAHEEICQREVSIYPSSTFQQFYFTKKPILYTCIVALSFALMAVLILIYDYTVTRRQEKTMKSAIRSGKLIASIFPANVRERLMNDTPSEEQGKTNESNGKQSLEVDGGRTRPIADFFANTTVMCTFQIQSFVSSVESFTDNDYSFVLFAVADISGFTAWCSTRGESVENYTWDPKLHFSHICESLQRAMSGL
jgi:hypothetical protein